MQRVVASVAAVKAGTIEAVGIVHDDLAVKARDVSRRIQAGEDVPIDEALDVECLSTHAAASNLLCEAHDREDPLIFAEAQIRAESDRLHARSNRRCLPQRRCAWPPGAPGRCGSRSEVVREPRPRNIVVEVAVPCSTV